MMATGGMTMRHDGGDGWHDDCKGQQGDRRHDDGDGRHDDGNGQQGNRRHDNGERHGDTARR
jgi:hypothetical protein